MLAFPCKLDASLHEHRTLSHCDTFFYATGLIAAGPGKTLGLGCDDVREQLTVGSSEGGGNHLKLDNRLCLEVELLLEC